MMTMFRKGSTLLIFLLIIFLGSCKNNPKTKVPTRPQNKLFTLADSTQLVLPPTYILSENLNSESQLVAQVYADFLANLATPPSKVTFFIDSLAPNHHLAAYQVAYQPYNQNMAALLNTKLTQQFQHFDESQNCYHIRKIEAMQYASQEWNALKLKFKTEKDTRQKEDADCFTNFENTNSSIAYATIFYYNGQNKAYFFLEYFNGDTDLDIYLRKIRM